MTGGGETGRAESVLGGHAPVMLREALAGLAIRSDGAYLDATFGGGGHTQAILAASAPDGRVLAVDADPAAFDRAERLRALPGVGERLTFVRANFSEVGQLAPAAGFPRLDGALFDLGVSSFQLDDGERGFAFRFDGPLDMRMDPTRGAPAATMVATLDEAELISIFRSYGEEPQARRIARALVAARERAGITRTTQLAEIVSDAVGGRKGARTHPATRVFQALRIAVNDELGAIERGLSGAIELLSPGGRLVVIAFHSLEDRLVNRIIAEEATTCRCPEGSPICTCGAQPRLRRVGGSRLPAADEIAHNPRARSAVLRVAERLPVTETKRAAEVRG